MRNRQHLGAGGLLESVQELPEIFRVLAVELGKRHHPVGLGSIAAEQHVAVEIVTAHGGVFISDDRREAARVVVAVSQRRVGAPRIAHGPVALDRSVRLRQRSDNLHSRCEHPIIIAADQFLIPSPPDLGRQYLRVAAQ